MKNEVVKKDFEFLIFKIKLKWKNYDNNFI